MKFVVLSDHETLQPLRDGWERSMEGVLVLVGVEIRTNGGYLLGLGLPAGFRREGRDPGHVVQAIRRAGGLAFLVHPCHPFLGWRELPPGLTGLEVLNLHSLSRQAASLASLPRFGALVAAGRATDALMMLTVRPSGELAMWDSLLAEGMTAGLASADAHGHVRLSRGRYAQLPSYAQSFRLVQTHLVTDRPLRGDLSSDRELVLDALRRGRCRLVYGCHGDPAGFEFFHAGAGLATEGEEARWLPGSRICVISPRARCLHRLYRDGRLVAAGEGRVLVYPCPGPGAYRLETDIYAGGAGAWRWGVRPWLFTNPIYLRPPALADQPQAVRSP
jgi:hypothetical protein